MVIDYTEISLEELAGLVCQTLERCSIHAMLVGGACVSIYSANKYQSYDLDMVTYADMQKVANALQTIGFIKDGGYFKHALCPYFIDFVTPPVAVGNQLVNLFENINTRLGTIILLSAIDCVKDRLASYFYWNDTQALAQALLVAKAQPVNFPDIATWVQTENAKDKYQHFLSKLASD